MNQDWSTPALLSALGTETITSKAQGIADVTSGNIDGYIFYPSDFSNGTIEIYGKKCRYFQ